ncbi:MAG: sensor histidine kinase [Pseudomonadota bacterium]
MSWPGYEAKAAQSPASDDTQRLTGRICHRAKNDLQTIANMLAVASPYMRSPAEMAEAMEGRVGAFSICYSLISATGAWPMLDRLAEEVLRRWLWRVVSPPRLERRLPELRLSLRLCSPLALWLYEVIGNALQHGHNGHASALGLYGRLDAEGLTLRVVDNGPGLPPGFDPARHARLGLKLAQSVAKTDLRGRMQLADARPGLEASLWVPTAELDALNRDA